MNFKLLIITMFIVICPPSCKQNKRRNAAVKIVSEYTSKEIIFPEVLSCISMDNSGIWILYNRIITESETKVLTMEKCGGFTSYLKIEIFILLNERNVFYETIFTVTFLSFILILLIFQT